MTTRHKENLLDRAAMIAMRIAQLHIWEGMTHLFPSNLS